MSLNFFIFRNAFAIFDHGNAVAVKSRFSEKATKIWKKLTYEIEFAFKLRIFEVVLKKKMFRFPLLLDGWDSSIQFSLFWTKIR